MQFIGGLKIGGNPKLNDLSGLSNIKSILYTASIYDNVSLTTLSAFSVGTDVDTVEVADNTMLQDLQALGSLKTVKNTLTIYGNQLSSLTDLSSLSSVGGLQLGEQNIENLSGLENLITIGKV